MSTTPKNASPNSHRNYVVILLDLAFNTYPSQFVKAKSGWDAGMYALQFDSDGAPREDGYQLVSVMSAEDLAKVIGELEAFKGETVPSLEPPEDYEQNEGIFIGE